MNILKQLSLAAALTGFLPVAAFAQNDSIETDANLKDTTTHIVTERKVIETTKTYQQDTTREAQRKIAIIVQNRAGARLNDKVPVLEDMLSSRVAGNGLAVISRGDVTDALKTYSSNDGAAQVSDDSGTTKLDQMLSDNTSALRLAQNLGADFILVPSIATYGTEKINYSGNGVSTLNIKHTLRLSYKIVEAGEGGAVKGGMVSSTKTIRQSAGLQTDDGDLINELLDDAAQQVAELISKDAKRLPVEVRKAAMVRFSVQCTMSDPRQQPILVSALGVTADNRIVATNQPVAVQPMDVTVELDGVALGSAPGQFQGRPGLHKIRLSREGFEPWERTINVYDGQVLRVALQLTDAAYNRWAETTAFLASLDNDRKLTDAEVKRIEGIAKFFSESHYRVDTAENVKIYKSIY